MSTHGAGAPVTRLLSFQRLAAALAVLGVLAGLAIVLLPLEVGFAGDPLLRLQVLGGAPAAATTGVRCGSALANLGRRGDGLSLYSLARDRACREAATRRTAVAVAAAGIVGLLGAIGLAGARTRAAVA